MAAVRALYWRAPTAEELAGTGLKPKHYKEPEVEVWDENWPAIDLFRDNYTQWRVGAGGYAGLDFAIFHREIERRGLDHDDTMWRISVIEDAALDQLRELTNG